MCILKKRIADWNTNRWANALRLGGAADGVCVRACKEFGEEKTRGTKLMWTREIHFLFLNQAQTLRFFSTFGDVVNSLAYALVNDVIAEVDFGP